jgi:hypothetical protein
VTLQILAAANMEMIVFRDVAPYSLAQSAKAHKYFGEIQLQANILKSSKRLHVIFTPT